jgi:hypothetical protein
MDNLTFKGRIFEINEDHVKEENEDSYQYHVDEYITPRVETILILESKAPTKSEKRKSVGASGDSGGTGTPEQISI